MKRIHAILAVAACSAVVTGVALAQQTEQPRPQQQQATALSPGDKLFVDAAFDINQGEILLGKLAQEKGTTAAVKQYGARMEKDHTAALDDLRDIAHKDGFALPAQVSAAQRTAYDDMSKLSGTAFDSAYLDHMKTGHMQAISKFANEAQTGQNPDLKNYASSLLAVLHMHETLVQEDLQHQGAAPSQGAPQH